MSENKHLLSISVRLAESMLGNNGIMLPHMEKNPADSEVVKRAVKMAKELIELCEGKGK